MKVEIDSPDKLTIWIQNPTVPAIFQGIDLRDVSPTIATIDLNGCAFLGCKITGDILQAAANSRCLVMHPIEGLPFNPFRTSLYSPEELYDQFKLSEPEASYEKCLDKQIYDSYKKNGKILRVGVDVTISRRIHDASISDALDDLLTIDKRKKTVAIMGGHDVGRDTKIYHDVALLCQQLSEKHYLIITGGGPGLMEAANLGAYTAGFEKPTNVLNAALLTLKDAPKYNDKNWLAIGYKVWSEMGKPSNVDKSQNFSIPTWFYGHEPPNIFATHIAKYFENSIREEGLLAVALAGVVFAEGNGGTVQEIFQDACQNYYKTQEDIQSPMILYGIDYWAPSSMIRHDPKNRKKDVYSLLEKLAVEKGFSDKLLITDDMSAIIKFIDEKSPK